MQGKLIHSMVEFSPLIGPALLRAQARNIVEIGAEFGGMSQFLADLAQEDGGRLVSIDPSPKDEFCSWAASHKAVDHIQLPSLEAIPQLENIDAWVIDGDHNYFTVLHELRAAHEISCRDQRPFLAFLHDVGWPCARRDCYYAPERIPATWRHPHDYDGGVLLGRQYLVKDRGFRGMGQFAWATRHGGPRNGVLTAVEDFLKEAGEGLRYVHVPAVFGLGVIFDQAADWAEDVAGMLLPWHENALLGAMELNRLENYLAVIEWQDSNAQQASQEQTAA